MSYSHQVLTTEQILETIWDYDFLEDSNIVEIHVRYLRFKLEREGEKRLIQTIRGIGYSLHEHGFCS